MCSVSKDLRNSSEAITKMKSKAKFIALLVVLISLTLALPSQASEVSIGNVSANPGDVIEVPIMIDSITDLGSADLNLTYNSSVVIAVNVTGGDFDVTISNLEHNVSGLVRIGAFQTEKPGLNGSVIFALVKLKAVGNTGEISPLNISVNTLKDATNECNNISHTITNGTFTIKPSAGPTPTPTPSPGGGGGGGGGGYAPTTPTPAEKSPVVVKVVKIISRIEAGKPESVTFEGLDVYKISIEADKNVNDVNVMVEELEKPKEIAEAPGIVYAYYNITATNLTDVNVTTTIEFKVSKSWMADENIETIRLCRYDEEWKALPTTKIDEDDAYVYFSAETHGFSIFAISGTKKEEAAVTPALTTPATPATTITPPATAPTPAPTPAPAHGLTPLFLILIVTAVIVIAGITIIVLRRK